MACVPELYDHAAIKAYITLPSLPFDLIAVLCNIIIERHVSILYHPLLTMRLYTQETELALIHIPLELYSNFLQPILQLLLPSTLLDQKAPNGERPSQPSSSGHSALPELPFVNISLTPIEASIACSRHLANELFSPIQVALPATAQSQITITPDDYVVMQVDGEGLDAGQRVLELTSPLALAGISIFFITTYFSDYILVPVRARQQVISALEARGFAFEENTSSYTTASTTAHTHRNASSASSFDLSSISVPSAPGTPLPTTVSELQSRTFALLKRRHVEPHVDDAIKLVSCAGRKSASGSQATNAAMNDRLHLGLVRALISQPKFLSLTLTDTEPPSLLLERRLLPLFSTATSSSSRTTTSSDESILLGSKSETLIPIILDLRDLPLESTGIVCGVAARLVGGTKMGLLDAVEMSYLSTARAGTVMVAEGELDRALGALSGWDDEQKEN